MMKKTKFKLKFSEELIMFRYALFFAGVLVLTGCPGIQSTRQSDDKLNKAIAESDQNQSEKLDFLKDEKLPNEEYYPADSGSVSETDSGYTEVPPTISAKYRIQVFSGSAANAQKLYNQYTGNHNATDVYVLHDAESGFWKVWIGNYMTRPEADSAKVKLTELGFSGAWVKEMPQTSGSVKEPVELFWVQMGSFQKESSAQTLFEKLKTQFKDQVIIKTAGSVYKVWIGGFTERSMADDLKSKLVQQGYAGVFIVQGTE